LLGGDFPIIGDFPTQENSRFQENPTRPGQLLEGSPELTAGGKSRGSRAKSR
jgi:hypothetical protein